MLRRAGTDKTDEEIDSGTIERRNITGLDLALLLNFKNARLEWKRVLRPREAGEHDTTDLHA
jgi:hypothetical protein